MKIMLHVLACLLLVLGMWACERPKSPNFKINHDLEVPLTTEKTYTFLGQGDALIDTTSINFVDEGGVVDPAFFDSLMNFSFNFVARNASFNDTLAFNLGGLPGNNQDQTLSEGALTINYTNGLPLDLDLSLIMLNGNGNEVIRTSNFEIDAAKTNNSGAVEEEGANKNKIDIGFTEQELGALNDIRSLVLDGEINTPNQNVVKVRGSDYIDFYLQMKVQITTIVN